MEENGPYDDDLSAHTYRPYAARPTHRTPIIDPTIMATFWWSEAEEVVGGVQVYTCTYPVPMPLVVSCPGTPTAKMVPVWAYIQIRLIINLNIYIIIYNIPSAESCTCGPYALLYVVSGVLKLMVENRAEPPLSTHASSLSEYVRTIVPSVLVPVIPTANMVPSSFNARDVPNPGVVAVP